MSRPRQIIPGSFYLLTRRCAHGQLLLRPDEITNQTFIYCLAVAAQRMSIDVLMTCAMSNHHHTIVFDRTGAVVEFMEHFHKLVARAQNVHLGRSENLWSSAAPSLVRLESIDDVIDKLVYVATNPVKDGLVERVRHWPGVNGFSALMSRSALQAQRPRHFFRAHGPMPKSVSLELVIPPELGDADEIRRIVRERVAAVEELHIRARRACGRPVLGRRGVLQQSWKTVATSQPRRGEIRPHIAARSLCARRDAIQRDREFIAAYRDARARWLAGEACAFPVGTYWLRRFANVPIQATG